MSCFRSGRTRPHHDGADLPTRRGDRRRRRPSPSPRRLSAARRPRAAAVDVGQHRLPETGAAVAYEPGRQRRRDRRVSRHPRNRQGRNDIADVVLLRPVGDPQPPAGRGRHHPDRSLGDRRRVLGAVPPPPRHRVRGRAVHLRTARAGRVRHQGLARPALPHPGRRQDASRASPPVRRACPTPRLGPVRDVRRNGGDRPNGISATGTRVVAPSTIGMPIPGGSFTIEPVDGGPTTR